MIYIYIVDQEIPHLDGIEMIYIYNVYTYLYISIYTYLYWASAINRVKGPVVAKVQDRKTLIFSRLRVGRETVKTDISRRPRGIRI